MEKKEIIRSVLTYVFDFVLYFTAAFIVGVLVKKFWNLDFSVWRFALCSTIGWLLFRMMKAMKFIIDIAKRTEKKQTESAHVRDRLMEPVRPFPLNLEVRDGLLKMGKLTPAYYELKFMFDYCADSCLWCDNDNAFKKYGVGPIDLQALSITDELRETLTILNDQFGEAFFFDSDNCTMSCVWTDDERAEFRERTRVACWQVKHELGSDYEVYWEVHL